MNDLGGGREIVPGPGEPSSLEIAQWVLARLESGGLEGGSGLMAGPFGFAYQDSSCEYEAALRLRTHSELIGHYDPSRPGWLFYPEYVTPAEAELLSVRFQGICSTLGKLGIESGRPFVNLFDDVTVSARMETADLLRSIWDPQDLLDRDARRTPEGDIFPDQLDDSVTCYIGLLPRLLALDGGKEMSLQDLSFLNTSSSSKVSDQFLAIVYDKIRLQGSGGYEGRGTHFLYLGERSSEDPSNWERLDLITQKEWKAVKPIIATLLAYKELHRNFSAEKCAVVSNMKR